MTVVLPRYFVRINGTTAHQGQVHKAFITEQAAAEFAWDEIKRGAYVVTFNDLNNIRHNWTYDYITDGIEGKPI